MFKLYIFLCKQESLALPCKASADSAHNPSFYNSFKFRSKNSWNVFCIYLLIPTYKNIKPVEAFLIEIFEVIFLVVSTQLEQNH